VIASTGTTAWFVVAPLRAAASGSRRSSEPLWLYRAASGSMIAFPGEAEVAEGTVLHDEPTVR
jgi:hypothetical protein